MVSMCIRPIPKAKNQPTYIAKQVHLTYLGSMSLEWSLASILVETILAVYSTVNYAAGNDSTSEVASASVSTVIAFVELWI